MPNHWDKNAAIRSRQIEDGLDLTFTKLFVPYYEDLVNTLCPSSLLEVGCGTGHLVSLLANHIEERVVALEPSRGMQDIAQKVLYGKPVQLLPVSIEEFSVHDTFDLIISHFCAQVVPNFSYFLASIVRHMHTHSQLVFSIPHPCFYNGYKQFFPENEYAYMQEIEKTVSFTITKEPETPISGVPYHHRPLGFYFSKLASEGLCVLQFHEMYPSPVLEQEYGTAWDLPRYCSFQCARVNPTEEKRE